MFESLKIRFAIIFITLVLSLTYLFPNFVPIENYPWWPSKNRLIYGLDIQGGLHLVLSANVDELIKQKFNSLKTQLREELEASQVKVDFLSINTEKNPYSLSVQVSEESSLEALKSIIQKIDTSQSIQVINSGAKALKLIYYEARIIKIKEDAVGQAIEVIRNRIDEFGVSEPVISAQGRDRILVQLPGIEDSRRAKELIQKTAKLEFALVNEEFSQGKLMQIIEASEKKGGYSLESSPNINYRQYVRRLNSDVQSQLPENNRIVFEKAPSAKTMKAGKIPYLVDKTQSVQGSNLEDAYVAFDQEFNRPIVSFKFQPEGRKLFGDLTGQNIGKRLAVILDDTLKSAPVVQSKISDQGQISLGQGNHEELLEEANMIASTLKAGALPVDLEQLEEKTIGPTLGKDSIQKGQKAGLIGLLLVIFFMFLNYRFLGFISNIGLVLNMFFLLALLSSLSATITLPGVAGIILTIGMAVDANVIIFQRIKEELGKGASLKLAVKDGFGHAFSAILDANVTTSIVCFILIYFGTGPIRGFAVTLFCGIITSLFTSVFVSRAILDLLIIKYGLKKI